MTFSQKIALAFTIAGFILLVPGTFGLIMVALFLSNPSVETISFFFTILMVWAAGGALLRGYLKHARYKFDRASAIWLWVCTIVFNAVPAAMMSYWSITEYNRLAKFNYSYGYEPLSWLVVITFSYILAVVLAAAALKSELKRVE